MTPFGRVSLGEMMVCSTQQDTTWTVYENKPVASECASAEVDQD
jgi:hypothetical protein